MNEELMNFLIRLALFILALVLLLVGRRVFWLIGGAALGLTAAVVATYFLEPSAFVMSTGSGGFSLDINPQREQTGVVVAGIVGVLIGVALTWWRPREAAGIVGFVAGAFLLLVILDLFQFPIAESVRRSLIIIGAVALSVVAIRQPSQTMIVISCVLGADLLITSFQANVNSPLSAFIWLVAVLAGIIFQVNSLRLERLKIAEKAGSALVPPPLPS